MPRERHLSVLPDLLRRHPVVAILGARQIGKTTLSRQLLERLQRPATVFDLEDPFDLARLDEPRLALQDLQGLIVIDEVQERPDLFPILRVLVDRPDNPAHFLILGSASPDLLRQSSETLAGRIHYHELHGFTLDEVGVATQQRLWLRGGFPRSLLAESDAASLEWRYDFVRTYLERDLPQLGVRTPAVTLRRFWTMLAHYHGQIWNASALAQSFGISAPTVRRYLDVLTSTFVVRQLLPWHENLKKRQVKAPKIYVADSGLLHCLLDLETRRDLERHPKVGASWEGHALNEVTNRLGARPEQCFFWATHAGAELDLLVTRGEQRWGFEFKRTASPRPTQSMYTALEDLRLERIDVVYPGEQTFPLRDRIRALGISRLLEDLEPLA
ncbi:MAG: ATP-binding protein [bacterium]|nr:ATP-binding protein [bacterium]